MKLIDREIVFYLMMPPLGFEHEMPKELWHRCVAPEVEEIREELIGALGHEAD